MLSPQFLANRKRELLKDKARLEKISRGKDFEEYGDSEDDNAQEVATFEKNLSARRDFQQSLSEVNAALEKIEQGKYGQCAMGPEKIEEERLKAFPAAAVCIKHQKELDAKSAGRWYKPWTWRR